MIGSRLTPQASAAFNACLDEMLTEIDKDILEIKQRYSARGILMSSQTVFEIYQLIDKAISATGRVASESARLAYEVGNHRFSELLESELLDVFETNFSRGYQRLCAIRIGSTQPIRDGLGNKQMFEYDEHLQVAQRAQVHGQLELRQYFQSLKRARKH